LGKRSRAIISNRLGVAEEKPRKNGRKKGNGAISPKKSIKKTLFFNPTKNTAQTV